MAEPGDIPPGGYNINKARITLANNSVIQGYSADSAERARGANLFGCWCDELALFKYESFYHEVLQPALRRGDARMLITTTPSGCGCSARSSGRPRTRPATSTSREPGATRTRISPRCG